jgi:hypothetical protein
MTTSHSPAVKKAPQIKPLPQDVIDLVTEASKRMTGADLADKLGVSTSAVSQAKHNKFQGNVDRFVARVRGALMGSSVTCPVLGEINTKVCLDQQNRQAVFSNPQRVALAKACKTCPNAQRNQPTGESHAD